MLWMLPVAGAVGGALLNRRRPLQGAMMGGLLGAGAGYFAPALGIGAGTAASSAGAAGASSAGASSGGLLGYAKPALEAMSAAQMANGLMGGGDSQMQAPQMQQAQATGPQTLASIAQANEQQNAQMMQEQMRRRMMNRGRIQQMMGNNYG